MVREVFCLKINKKLFIICLVIPLAVGGIAALLTGGGMDTFETLNQPPLSPPGWLFPVVWSILYAFMGIGAARISLQSPSTQRNQALNLYIGQLIVNFFWSLIFFNAQRFGFAFFWILLLLVLVVLMTLAFRKLEPAAGWLQIPYILWLLFATYLSLGVWYLNR